MADNKTKPTDVDVQAFLQAVEHPVRRADALTLDAMFRRVTGWQPRMWGPTMIGYGSYHYIYDSGREGDCLATGFSPRKANLTLYIMPGYQNFGGLLDRLGKHKTGKACLYINKLADVDLQVLEEIVRAGLEDLGTRWTITPS
ncbi:DUF1801 domain-containing protein [Thalassorhabdomicrobium marinisediminis]|uniref:YdhG-like domain-containing protein n=1 Tax=Thalassorhabdomicrobium marinisediminis TaxID=2170577 RepID=A0A2T7FVK8_9RHOB|nr:DUF1801 domain-containing protein [Thalassorhabdomicrobium marinisediminis]PVA06184.1 hypothetical protein DC363_09710 [Thalassorhabdomicrobium marinisediminis]